MIPYLLVIAGGYLIGDSMKESKSIYADGGTMDNGGGIDNDENILTLEMKSLLKQNSDLFGVGDFDADEMDSGYAFTQQEFNYVIDDSNNIDDVIRNIDKKFNIESRDMVLEILN